MDLTQHPLADRRFCRALGVGAAFAGLARGLVLSVALWVWHQIERLLSLVGWVATPPPITVPVQLPSYPLVDLYCAWAVVLFGCTGFLNLVLLWANNPARVTLSLPAPWVSRLRARFSRGQARPHGASNRAIWATWFLGLAVIPGTVVAKTVFT
jgi:hypothetical protein